MAIYEFACDKCKITWEKEGSMLKPLKRSKCPKCKKQRERHYSLPTLQFKGMDFYVNMSKARKFHRYGASKDDALRYYNESIKATNKRLNDKTSPYTNMHFTPEVAKNMGARKVTQRETREKIETAKRLTKETNMIHSYNKRRNKNG